MWPVWGSSAGAVAPVPRRAGATAAPKGREKVRPQSVDFTVAANGNGRTGAISVLCFQQFLEAWHLDP